MGIGLTRRSGGTGWPLRDTPDLMSALTELTAQGWSGGIEFAGGNWKLILRMDGKNTVNAELGQWLVLDGELKALPCSDFDAQGYTPGAVVEFPQTEEPAPEVIEDPTPFGSMKSPDVSSRMVR